MEEQLKYKGKEVTIAYEGDDHAEVRIEGRSFAVSRHGGGLPMWSCEDAYFMSDDLYELIRHLIDYWYIVTSSDTAPAEGPAHGDLPPRPGGALPAHGDEGHFELAHGKGKGKGKGARGRRSGGRTGRR